MARPLARGYDPTDSGLSTNWREGVMAGVLGAAVVALFYLVFDIVVRGAALRTPSILGQLLVLGQRNPDITAINGTAILLYTIVHIIAFVVFGYLLTALALRSERSDLARYGVVQLLIVFELFFYGLLAVADSTTRGAFPFWSVLAANSLAAIAMGTWLWMRHPKVRAAIARAPLGSAEEEASITT